MALVQLLAFYLAGLSFFFAGVSGISENLRLMSGQRFRLLLGRATNHPVLAGLLGIAMGAITQNTSVVAFILTGMVASGMLALRRALLVLACASIGTAVLVFVAALDLHLPVLFLIGISGLAIAFKWFTRWKPGLAGLLSIGLVLFGLEMMKQAFDPVSSSHGASYVGQFFGHYPGAAYLAGALMRSFIHSSSTVAAITITVSKGTALGDYPAMMSVAGIGLGSAIANYLLTLHLKGIPRQISLHQSMTNFGASLLLASLLTVERLAHLPMLAALIYRLASGTSGRVAFTYLALNLAIVVVGIATLSWAPRWLAVLSPPTEEEDLSLPRYVQPEAIESPETALDLVAMEQLRVVETLVQYLQFARGDAAVKPAALHESVDRLSTEIGAFLEALVRLPIPAGLATRSLSFQRKQEILGALEENVFLFAQSIGTRQSAIELASVLVESLDMILLTATDALQSGDPSDVDLLMQLTEDRGGMMERMRNQLRVEDRYAIEDISSLHYATTLFERNVWLCRQLALWMRADAKAVAA